MRIRLIQPRERFGPPDRQEELEDCWSRSWGLFDSYATPSGQPHMNELFDLCEDGMLNVVANGDIFFDAEGIELLRNAAPGPKSCFALSRWDVDKEGNATLYDHSDSQDVWIFNGKPKGIDAGFKIGRPGGDNHLMWLIQQAGYKVFNPSKSIKAYHLHNVQWRSYLLDPEGKPRGADKLDRVSGPFERLAPHAL